ncbi:MAG TPA: class I SAM-dependent methyltransferase [Candidatus Krumholzibacteria bacterium]|nr:class I SAM-dependent methyltransferase [Candidatus Krumholzibacteria bacterium]
MSFWPFPTNLRDELARAADLGPVVEAGAGDGRLSVHLRSLGWAVVSLDHDPRCDGLDVLADLRELPFASASVGVVVFGDVLRHLPSSDRARAAESCVHCLAPGGRVVVLEDTPVGRDPAEVNYREVLSLLADIVPGRGAARRIDRVSRELRAHLGDPVCRGDAENSTRVDDPLAPVRWLRTHHACDRDCRERLDAIADSIAEHGMRYGRYSFEVFATGAAA